MKRVSVLLLWLLSFTFVMAQQNNESVIVHYRGEIKMDIKKVLDNVPAQARAQVENILKNEIKKGIYIDYTLKTNGKESIYRLDEKLNNAQTQGGVIANQIKQTDKTPYYKNLEKGIYKKTVDMMGMPKYIITDSLNIKWNITREKSQVLNFEVRKATGKLEGTEITAWYAPKLAIKDGPAQIAGLPGLVLKTQISQEGTDVSLIATKVELTKEPLKVEEPTQGKVVTLKEFQEEMKKLAEKMKEMMGNGVEVD